MTVELKEGHVISISTGDRVYADIPLHFQGCRGNFEITRNLIDISEELGYLAGEYIVTRIEERMNRDGGNHQRYVTCESVEDEKRIIGFYHGSRNCKDTLSNVRIVGEAHKKWII